MLPVRKCGRWLVLVSFLSTFYVLSRKFEPPESRLLSQSSLTSAQLHKSDVQNAVDSKAGEVEVHIPENMMESWKKGSRIRQASMMIGDQHMSVLVPCVETHLDHARKWGYPTHILKHSISGRAGRIRFVLEKLLHVLSMLMSEMAKASHERADWIVWFDADTIIINNNIPWRIFHFFSDIDFIASRDWNEFNYGVFFVRVNKWSVSLFKQVAAFPKSSPDVITSGDIDTDAIWGVLERPENQGHVTYQPRSWYNGYDLGNQGLSEIQEGNMQVYFAGVDNERGKEAAIHWWLSEIEQSPQKLRVPLEATSYAEKVEMFWEVLSIAKELLQECKERSYRTRGKIDEVKAAQEELENYIRFAAFDIEGSMTAVLTLHKAYEYTENQIAEDHRSSMVAAIALIDAHLNP